MTDEVYVIKLPDFWFSDSILQDLITIGSIWIISGILGFFSSALLRWYDQRHGNYALGSRRRLWKTVLFAPGVMIHELSHLIVLFLTGYKIRKVQLFNSDEVSGFVEPESLEPKGFMVTFLVGFAPLLIG